MSAKDKILEALNEGNWQFTGNVHGCHGWERLDTGDWILVDFDAEGNMFGAEVHTGGDLQIIKGQGRLEQLLWKIGELNGDQR